MGRAGLSPWRSGLAGPCFRVPRGENSVRALPSAHIALQGAGCRDPDSPAEGAQGPGLPTSFPPFSKIPSWNFPPRRRAWRPAGGAGCPGQPALPLGQVKWVLQVAARPPWARSRPGTGTSTWSQNLTVRPPAGCTGRELCGFPAGVGGEG